MSPADDQSATAAAAHSETISYMRGLVAPLERNGWTLAEEAGHAGPDRIHRLLIRIEWDADEVLDDVRDYVVGILSAIARRTIAFAMATLVSNATMAWLAGCRRLHRRYERTADRFLAFTSIACTLICYRRLKTTPGVARAAP